MNAPGCIDFRPALAHETRTMAEMSRELVESGLGWRYTPLRMAVLIRERETVALVACSAARMQGFAIMQFRDEHAHLALLCVDPAQRRSGIARRMTDWLVESAEVAGIVTIRLDLRKDNAAALALYRRLGFTETGLVAGYYSDRNAARQMVRRLRHDVAMR